MACSHNNRDAISAADCGEPQQWECLDCGIILTLDKPHYVEAATTHGDGCTETRLPVAFCRCTARKFGWCLDCGAEFPHSVTIPGCWVEIPY